MRRSSRTPWFAWTRTPTVQPPSAADSARDAVPIPPLSSWQIIPVPPPTEPSGDRAVGRRVDRGVDVLRRHVEAVHVVERAVERLADDGEGPELGPVRVGRAVARATIASRTTPTLWVFVSAIGPDEEAGLVDPRGAGELAVAVEAVPAREEPLEEQVAVVRDDRGDAGPHRTLADDERAVAADDGRVADADAGHVGDRVRSARARAVR